MNQQRLKNAMQNKGTNKAGLAKMAGVSRAAITHWFHKPTRNGWINTETFVLMHLAKELKIAPESLLADRPDLTPLHTEFLWDSLYPNMEAFLKALSQFENPAMARLVQIVGLHAAHQILGPQILTKFQNYKAWIKPVRRKGLELIWPLYSRSFRKKNSQHKAHP